MIENNHKIEAIICYFLTDEIGLLKFDNKSTWSFPYDLPDGDIMFIDKMVARKWTKSLRIAVYNAIENKYPFVEKVIWLREPKNRHVIIKMRGNHVHSQVS